MYKILQVSALPISNHVTLQKSKIENEIVTMVDYVVISWPQVCIYSPALIFFLQPVDDFYSHWSTMLLPQELAPKQGTSSISSSVLFQ